MNKKGLFIGKSHDDGGIPSMIKETGTPIEIEGEEYYICRESYNSTDVHSFKNKTNKEVLDSIYTKYSCTLVQEVMNAGDFIVCKVVVNDKSKRDRSGTVKEILNQMQSEKSCKVEDASSVARRGGGVSGELLAPNGKKSNLTPKQYKLVRTDAFKDWFGDWENDPENSSKVIDDNGEPKVVYHGSDKNGVGFTKFNTTIKSPRNVGEFQWEEFGAFFSDDYKTAEYYAFKGETRNIPSLSGEVRGFFLDIKNPLISFNNDKMWYDVIPEIFEKHERKQNGQLHKPLIVKRQFLYTSRNKRYDGFIVKGINEADVPNTTTYHIKKSSQAKLADGSNVKFNPKSNDIRFKDGGQTKKMSESEINDYYEGYNDYHYYYSVSKQKDDTYRLIISYSDKRGYPRDAEKKAMNKSLPSPPKGYKYKSTIPETYDGKPMTYDLIKEWDEDYDDRGYTEYEFDGQAYYTLVPIKEVKQKKVAKVVSAKKPTSKKPTATTPSEDSIRAYRIESPMPQGMLVRELIDAGISDLMINKDTPDDSVIVYGLTEEPEPINDSVSRMYEDLEEVNIYRIDASGDEMFIEPTGRSYKNGGGIGKTKRYTADADFFVYAKSDREAEKEAREILSKIDKKYDNSPSLNHLHETPFGSIKSRKLFSGGGGVGASKPSFDDFDNTRDAIIALMRYYGVDFHISGRNSYPNENIIAVNLNWAKFPRTKEDLTTLMDKEPNLVYEFNTPVVSGSEPLFTINQYGGEIGIQSYNSVGLFRLFGKSRDDFSNRLEYASFIDSEVEKLRDEAFNSPKTKTKKQTKVVKPTGYTQENIFSRNLSSLIDKSSNDELVLERSKLVELLDYFEAPKDLVAIKEISHEINRINTKINDLLVSENSKIGSVDSTYLFTPSNLLNYYYTQTSQSPVNKKIVPCKLKTPNGAKSKLPVDTYWQVRTEAFKKWFGDWELAYKTDNYNDCSLIIDKDTKEPRIMFHGVRKFHPKFQMANMGKGVKRPYGTFEPESFPASYFSDNLEYVKFYGGNAKDMPTPYSGYNGFYYNVFINMRNPILLDELGFKSSINDFTDYLLVRYGLSVKVSDKIINAARGDYDRPIKTWAYIREGAEMIEQFKANGYDGIVQLGDVPRFDNKGDSIIDSEYLSFYPNQIKSADVKNSHFLPIFEDIRFKDGGSIGEDENNNESLSEILKKY